MFLPRSGVGYEGRTEKELVKEKVCREQKSGWVTWGLEIGPSLPTTETWEDCVGPERLGKAEQAALVFITKYTDLPATIRVTLGSDEEMVVARVSVPGHR